MSRGVMGTSLCRDPPPQLGRVCTCFFSWTHYHANRIRYALDIFPLKTFHLSKKFQVKLIHFLVGFDLGLSDCL